MACFFYPITKGNFFLLNETKFEVCTEDFEGRLIKPKTVYVGQECVYYKFQNCVRLCVKHKMLQNMIYGKLVF